MVAQQLVELCELVKVEPARTGLVDAFQRLLKVRRRGAQKKRETKIARGKILAPAASRSKQPPT